jgi:hypothetical protein
MLNEKEDLINVGGLEEEKSNFGIQTKISNSIFEETKAELALVKTKNYKDINYQGLHYLMRALTDVLILVEDQATLFNSI